MILLFFALLVLGVALLTMGDKWDSEQKEKRLAAVRVAAQVRRAEAKRKLRGRRK